MSKYAACHYFTSEWRYLFWKLFYVQGVGHYFENKVEGICFARTRIGDEASLHIFTIGDNEKSFKDNQTWKKFLLVFIQNL